MSPKSTGVSSAEIVFTASGLFGYLTFEVKSLIEDPGILEKNSLVIEPDPRQLSKLTTTVSELMNWPFSFLAFAKPKRKKDFQSYPGRKPF